MIEGSGYQLDPQNIEAVRRIEAPAKATELCQFIQCCTWLSTFIPDFVGEQNLWMNYLKSVLQGGKEE